MKADLIFDFLKKLAANNNREWFKAHRETYDAVVSEVEALASILIARISFFEPGVMRLEPKDCMYRSIVTYASARINHRTRTT